MFDTQNPSYECPQFDFWIAINQILDIYEINYGYRYVSPSFAKCHKTV